MAFDLDDLHHLNRYVIRPVVRHLGAAGAAMGEAVERQILGTLAHEMALTATGQIRLAQLGPGPARGPGVEPDTAGDVLLRLLPHRRGDLTDAARGLLGLPPASRFAPDEVEAVIDRLPWDFTAGVVLARLWYLDAPPAIPPTLDEQAVYWGRWYHRVSPAKGIADYRARYRRLCQGRHEAPGDPLP